jgi:hypothetical protein
MHWVFIVTSRRSRQLLCSTFAIHHVTEGIAWRQQICIAPLSLSTWQQRTLPPAKEAMVTYKKIPYLARNRTLAFHPVTSYFTHSIVTSRYLLSFSLKVILDRNFAPLFWKLLVSEFLLGVFAILLWSVYAPPVKIVPPQDVHRLLMLSAGMIMCSYLGTFSSVTFCKTLDFTLLYYFYYRIIITCLFFSFSF